MGEMGERPVQVRRHPMAAAAVQEKSRIVCPLEVGTTIALTGHAIYEQEEPYEGRLSRTVLWEGRGEISPPDPIILRSKFSRFYK
jgi:hypothetical protein